MCLKYDAEMTGKLIKAFQKKAKSKRYGYKVVRKNRGPNVRLGSKLRYTKGTTVEAEPFKFESEAQLKDMLRGELTAGGIHVFIRRPNRNEYNYNDSTVIKVGIELDDILAAGRDGGDEPCFFVTKVKVLD